MSISFDRWRIRPALAACGLLASLAGGAHGSEATQAGAAFKTVPFDQAMKGQIDRSLPLQLALPSDYEMAALDPAVDGVVWGRPADLEIMRRTGEVPAAAGFFRGRLTADVGYDGERRVFLCGPDCDEAALEARIAAAGATGVTVRKQTNGVPVLLVEAETGSVPGAARKRLYLAYVATAIDSNVMLISYRAPADSADDGRSVWAAFSRALTESAARAPVQPAPELDFRRHLEAASRSDAFRPAVDVFVAAARGGDAMTSFELLGPAAVAAVGRDQAWTYLTSKVLPFFKEFAEPGRSTTIAPAGDGRGNSGFVFHMTMKTKQGGERPFSIYVVEENGEKVIVNVLLDHDFRTVRR